MGRLEDIERHYKPHEGQALSPHTRAVARAVLSGLSTQELATRFGLSIERIVQIRHSPVVKQEIARIEERLEDHLIDKELKGLSTRAMEIIAAEAYSEVPSKRRTETAFKILDRTGYYPKNEQVGNYQQNINFVTFAPLPGEKPEEALERIRELKLEMGSSQEEEEFSFDKERD